MRQDNAGNASACKTVLQPKGEPMQNKLHYTFPVPHNVFEDEKFKKYIPSVKLVCVWLFKLHNRFANKDGWFFSSTQTLSQDIGISENTVKKAKKILKADGRIDIKPGKYNQDKNTRHASWFKVNGFLNKGKNPETNNETQQDNIPDNNNGIVTREALVKKFPEAKGVFDWLIESDCLEKVSDTEGRLKVTENELKIAASKKYPKIYCQLSKYLEQFRIAEE